MKAKTPVSLRLRCPTRRVVSGAPLVSYPPARKTEWMRVSRAYIDGKITEEDQIKSVLESQEILSRNTDTLVIEGTGHSGVGSIIGMNNARVASLLGADCLLVANGGLGVAFDELELQRVMMKEHGVKVRALYATPPRARAQAAAEKWGK